MVRPIEIIDSLSKVQAVERMQQQAKAIPETVQQFQKALEEKAMSEMANTANPPAPNDQILLHANERDKKKIESDEYKHEEPRKEKENPRKKNENRDNKSLKNPEHIDIKI